MIKGNIRDAEKYCCVNPHFAEAFAELKKISKNFFVQKIEKNGIRYMCQCYDTQPKAERKIEGHRKYVDIQFVIDGEEKMWVGNIADLKSKVAYNPEKDIEFFDGQLNDCITVKSGEFAIFFPEDLHQPACMSGDKPDTVKKVIVKMECA